MAGFQSPITIKDAISRINRNDFLLPSFQREYVWTAIQIEMLFDSIMKGYPISSMLFWKVSGNAKSCYRFYSILRYYVEGFHVHNDVFNTNQVNDFWAVLDGQQRLTSIYLGLCGSYAYKKHRVRWQYSESNFPTRHLYLNISRTFSGDEIDKTYDFVFIDKARSGELILFVDENGDKWFKVSKIMDLGNPALGYDIDDFADEYELTRDEKKMVRLLERRVFNEPLINYYEEDNADPDNAVNIFVRINSGGTKLSFSDILMSIAIASWQTKDARSEINGLVDNINNLGFNLSKDYVLKAFLVLYHKDVRFKLKSFSNDFISNIELNWEKIRDCILALFKLLKSFGFTSKTLTSYNATMPILFYLYHNDIYTRIEKNVGLDGDRKRIKAWLLKAILRKSFGGSSDSAITKSRAVLLTQDEQLNPKPFSEYPSKEISEALSKGGITDEEIEDLLLTQKDNAYAFAILSVLYPDLDYANNNFHLDHMHPASKWDSNDHPWEIHNSILNLQMLDGNENESKNDMDLDVWVKKRLATGINPDDFYRTRIIPAEVSLFIGDFNLFVEKRKELLKQKLSTAISED